ncbi:RecX family transcriptional regulator [Chloroflexi bacterium TSY]|nr:RecX family transcriptional regulator [Chloroflexi bacterium TSY]
MVKTITAIKIQKRNRQRVNVFLDNEYAFAIALSIAERLKRGQTLDPTEITTLKHEDGILQAYQASLHYLSFRQRTEKELMLYLQKKEYTEEVIVVTLERLRNNGYVDDAEFARAWVANRIRLKPRGARALQYELRAKGVSHEIIDHALSNLDEAAAAWSAIQSRLVRWQELDQQTFRQKVAGFLSRRGFGFDVVQSVLERAAEGFIQDEESG